MDSKGWGYGQTGERRFGRVSIGLRVVLERGTERHRAITATGDDDLTVDCGYGRAKPRPRKVRSRRPHVIRGVIDPQRVENLRGTGRSGNSAKNVNRPIQFCCSTEGTKTWV